MRSWMAEVFAINVMSCNLRGSPNIVLPKARKACMALILTGLFVKNYSRLCRRNLRVPNVLEIFKRNIKVTTPDFRYKLCDPFIVKLGLYKYFIARIV